MARTAKGQVKSMFTNRNICYTHGHMLLAWGYMYIRPYATLSSSLSIQYLIGINWPTKHRPEYLNPKIFVASKSGIVKTRKITQTVKMEKYFFICISAQGFSWRNNQQQPTLVVDKVKGDSRLESY
jgi:hypothetical protein